MEQPSYYRVRNYLFDHLIDKLPVDPANKKSTPRDLLKNGYWSPELGNERTEILKYYDFLKTYKPAAIAGRFSDADLRINNWKISIQDETPLSASEIMRYGTWFVMHPEKVAGEEVVTTSLFFPIKIKGDDYDVKNVIHNGIASLTSKPQPETQAPAKAPVSLMKLKLKARAIKLKLKLSEAAPELKKPDFVTRENTDLQTEYDYFNKVFFNNELKNVPLEWSMHKTRLGCVESRGIRGNIRSYIVHHLEISLRNKITYSDFANVLVHEMIHVYIITNFIRDDDSHGREFHKEMDRINNMNLGVKITVTGDTSGLEISDAIKAKEYVVVLNYQHQKPYGIMVYNRALHNDIQRYYGSYSKDFLNKHGLSFRFVLSDNPNLQKYRIKNAFTNTSFLSEKVNTEFFEMLEQSRPLSGIQPETEKIQIIRIS